MTLFDGGRWSRIRTSGWMGARQLGAVQVAGELNVWEAPLPRVQGYLDGNELTVAVSMGDAMNDRFWSVDVTVRLDPVAAAILERIIPAGWFL